MERVGFVGLGHMGWPMARNLSRGGVALTVYDAAPGRTAAFAAEVGGRTATDLTALAGACDVVITMLPNGDVVREVVLGSAGRGGLIAGLRPSSVVADMGSSDPAVYPELEAALRERGAQLIDAPVSGAVTGAEAGTLTVMAGGAAGALDRVEPLFRLVGQRVFRVGSLGAGQAMKALNNLASAGAFILALEILLIGQRFGLDPKLMTEILNVSTGRNNATDKKIIPHVLSRRFDSGFALGLMAKDLGTAANLAAATGTPTILGAPTVEAVRQALAALGPDADHTAIALWLEQRVGDELRVVATADDGRPGS